MNIPLILLICALVCFILATIPLPSKINLGWLGAAFITVALIVGRLVVVLFFAALMAGCANGKYVGPAASGKICYNKDGQRVCVTSDGRTILIEGDFKSVK